jgi:hypothetical protein
MRKEADPQRGFLTTYRLVRLTYCFLSAHQQLGYGEPYRVLHHLYCFFPPRQSATDYFDGKYHSQPFLSIGFGVLGVKRNPRVDP